MYLKFVNDLYYNIYIIYSKNMFPLPKSLIPLAECLSIISNSVYHVYSLWGTWVIGGLLEISQELVHTLVSQAAAQTVELNDYDDDIVSLSFRQKL